MTIAEQELKDYGSHADKQMEKDLTEFSNQYLDMAYTQGLTTPAKKAKQELEILEKVSDDALILQHKDAIIEFIDAFTKDSGYSGASVHYAAGAIATAIRKLILQEPLTPLTFEDSEWNMISYNAERATFQNNRESGVFKDSKDGKPYFLDGIVWKSVENDWDQFHGTVEGIMSRCYFKDIKVPKTFYVGVKVVEVDPAVVTDHFEPTEAYPFHHIYVIANKEELNKVEEYYELFPRDMLIP